MGFLETDDILVDADVFKEKENEVSESEATVLVSIDNVDDNEESEDFEVPEAKDFVYEGQLPFAADPVKKMVYK